MDNTHLQDKAVTASSQCRPRCLSIYFLVDDSLAIDNGNEARDCTRNILDWAHRKTTAKHPIYMKAIAYGQEACSLCRLQECNQIESTAEIFPRRCSDTPPNFAKALAELQNSFLNDLIKCGKSDGDSKPLVFVMANGDYEGQDPKSNYSFVAALENLQKICVFVLTIPRNGFCRNWRDILWFASKTCRFSESTQILDQLDHELQRFKREKQMALLSGSHSTNPDELTCGTSQQAEKTNSQNKVRKRISVLMKRPLAFIALIGVLFIFLYGHHFLSSNLFVSPGKLDYGLIEYGEDSSAKETKQLTIWKLAGNKNAEIDIKMALFFDDEKKPDYCGVTNTLNGFRTEIDLPVNVINLNDNKTHSITGHISLSCSEADWIITPKQIPLHISLQPQIAVQSAD